MDSTENGSKERVFSESEGGISGSCGADIGSNSESTKDISASEPLSWSHGQTIGPAGLKEGFESLKTLIEQAIEHHKGEIERLRKKVSPYSR